MPTTGKSVEIDNVEVKPSKVKITVTAHDGQGNPPAMLHIAILPSSDTW